jgi:hypothetical protein
LAGLATNHVLFLRGILAAAKALGRENEFYWLASDGWGKQQQVIAGKNILFDCHFNQKISTKILL